MSEAANSVLRVANANMADAVRLISIRRGYDPREFVLVVFGGAGPLHGVDLARELSIPTVLVPPHPGITSALGCLLVDIRHDLSTMFLGRVDAVDPADVEAEFENLENEAHLRLRAEGVAPQDMQLLRHIDMRYVGQWRSMSISTSGRVTDLAPIVEQFHAEHAREHNFRRDAAKVEVYRLNVTAIGTVPKPDLPKHEAVGATPTPIATRPGLVPGQSGCRRHPRVRPRDPHRRHRDQRSGHHRAIGLHRPPFRRARPPRSIRGRT